jgi:hypothetical protein
VFWIIEEARERILEDALGFFKLHAWCECPYSSVRPTRTGACLDNI